MYKSTFYATTNDIEITIKNNGIAFLCADGWTPEKIQKAMYRRASKDEGVYYIIVDLNRGIPSDKDLMLMAAPLTDGELDELREILLQHK